MRRLSYSQISVYERCPQLWYLQYVMKRYPPEKPQELVFGIAFHEAVEALINVLHDPDALKMAGAEFELAYVRESQKHPGRYATMGRDMLTALWLDLTGRDFQVLTEGVEKFVERDNFVGKIDCTCMLDGQKTIVDWKTASRAYASDAADQSEQLTAYAWLCKGQFDKLALCVVTKGAADVSWYVTTRTQEQMDAFAERVAIIRHMMDTMPAKGKYTQKACMAYNRRCEMWEMGFCSGLDDW